MEYKLEVVKLAHLIALLVCQKLILPHNLHQEELVETTLSSWRFIQF